MLTGDNNIYAHRKPGMFRTCAWAVLAISIWLVSMSVSIAILCGFVYVVATWPSIAFRSVLIAGFTGGAVAFWRLARKDNSRGMTIFGIFIALDLAVLAANVAGVL